MSIKIEWHKTPVPGGREDKGLMHARIAQQGTVNMERLCTLISSSSSFSPADIKGILEALSFWMGVEMAEGKSINLEGLGHFTPTLKSITSTDDKGKKKATAQVDSVSFRCATTLKKKLRETDLEIQKEKKEKTPAENIRKKNILAYVSKNVSVSSTDCMAMNHCNRYLALKDLQSLIKSDQLIETGSGKFRLYIRPYTSE